VVYDSASDIQVTDTQGTNVAPAAASEEITLAAPASVVPPVAVPTPTPVPEPVAEGDTEIKKERSQPVVVPSVTETKAAAVEEVQESILTKQF